jgi:membrane protease YdiL (CAAX protease family)
MPPSDPPDAAPRLSDARLTLLVGAAVGMANLWIGLPAQYFSLGAGAWVTEAVCFLGVSWAILRWSRRNPPGYVGLTGAPGWALGFGLLVGLANFFALVIPIQSLVQSGVDAVIHSETSPKLSALFTDLKASFDSTRLLQHRSRATLIAIASGVGLAAPFCEEFFFRGVIQQGLTRARVTGAVSLAALIFAIAHLDPVQFFALFELGLLFGALYAASGSLWACIGAHAANNGISLLIFFLAGAEKADETPDAPTVLACGAIGGLGLLGLLWAARRWPWLLGRARETGSSSP